MIGNRDLHQRMLEGARDETLVSEFGLSLSLIRKYRTDHNLRYRDLLEMGIFVSEGTGRFVDADYARMRHLLRSGATCPEVAREYGTSASFVNMVKNNLVHPFVGGDASDVVSVKARRSRQIKRLIHALYRGGVSLDIIAEASGYRRDYVARTLRDQGEERIYTVMTPDKQARLNHLWKTTSLSLSAIGRELGVSYATVSKWVTKIAKESRNG